MKGKTNNTIESEKNAEILNTLRINGISEKGLKKMNNMLSTDNDWDELIALADEIIELLE